MVRRGVFLVAAGIWAGCAVLVSGCGSDGKQSERVEPLRRVSVSTSGDWVGMGTKGVPKGFGDLPVDEVAGSASRPSGDAEEPKAASPTLTVVSTLTLLGLPSRGLESGQVFLPPQSLKVGETKSHVLGDRSDGCEVAYQVGEIKDGKVPVMVEVRMWGRRQTRQKWVTRLGAAGGESFQSTTRGGEQFRLSVLVEGIPPELANPERPSVLEEYLRSQSVPPPP
jgi:hypothetical protein